MAATHHVRLRLIEALYDYLTSGACCESFEEENVGADLAYLIGAIVKRGKCSWPEDRPFVKYLRQWPEEGFRTAAFSHIEIEED